MGAVTMTDTVQAITHHVLAFRNFLFTVLLVTFLPPFSPGVVKAPIVLRSLRTAVSIWGGKVGR